MNRVTVTLNHGGLVYSCHVTEYVATDRGAMIMRTNNHRMFFPWANVARVDTEPCDCDECEDGA